MINDRILIRSRDPSEGDTMRISSRCTFVERHYNSTVGANFALIAGKTKPEIYFTALHKIFRAGDTNTAAAQAHQAAVVRSVYPCNCICYW